MKKLISKLLIGMSLLTVSINSQAIVIADTIVSTMAFNDSGMNRYQAIENITSQAGVAALCLLTLPICILSEQEEAVSGVTVQGLTDKGYLNAEALLTEQASCMNTLEAQGKQFMLEANETAESIEAALVNACDASPALVNLYQNEIL